MLGFRRVEPIRITPPAASAPRGDGRASRAATSAGVRRCPRRGHGVTCPAPRRGPRPAAGPRARRRRPFMLPPPGWARSCFRPRCTRWTDDLLRAAQARGDLAVPLLLDQPREQRRARGLRELGERSLKASPLPLAGALLHAKFEVAASSSCDRAPSASRRRAPSATRSWRRLSRSLLRAIPNSHATGSVFAVKEQPALTTTAANVSAVRSKRELPIADTTHEERHDRIEMLCGRTPRTHPHRSVRDPAKQIGFIRLQGHHPYSLRGTTRCDSSATRRPAIFVPAAPRR